MPKPTSQRAAEKIAKVAARPNDLVTLWRDVTDVLAEAIPHYWEPCSYSVDPASLLITSHFQENLAEFPPECLTAEYYDDDVNQLADLARSASGITTLHDATRGDPRRSPRWHRNMKLGGDQEMIVALRNRSGEMWGAAALYREPGRPLFTSDEKELLRSLAPHLAEGTRRALLVGAATDPEGLESPGLIILNDRGDVESATPGTDRWLSELPGGDADGAALPPAVLSVATRALRTAKSRDRPGEVALARVLSRGGTWVVLHGANLLSAREHRVAVIIEPAHPARIYPLLMSAYGLTERERDVTRLTLQGFSTAQIADELVVSTHTVQQHLKSIFEKTGVRSRRDLVGKVFFTHYEPRFRDNEERVATQRPILGGPAHR
ncbi:hypothetical protein GCM10009609_10290 [Pseudonocardia aurantiaca]|uniref:LuxR C-terminal-related transcriptional regulator n=1 Tax=Pseudonocardia aurantiaca TaxID=75290 RepID=A0ABW4FB26_9PSEU